jgi:hypothetical protein
MAGRYKNPIPPRCLAHIDFLKIPAQEKGMAVRVPTKENGEDNPIIC